ncbi:hypothetical protein [Erythrobacter litoralis]|uniref:hypothetical protein n=1 Tax=Erythrobacter litoralis TaxID=39960 RepID=UPI0012371566|nr:hypothetical protein [Erythrobacter litoralis]
MTKPKDQHASLKLHRDSGSGEVSIGEATASIVENLRIAEAGTKAAVDTITLGVAANSVPCSGRGGARNRSNRESHALKRSQVENLLAATRFAYEIGLPFNRMITVHWEAAGLPLSDMPRATGHFIDLLSKNMLRRGAQIAWIFVHEGGEGKGGHAHIIVHIADDLIDVVTKAQKRWLRAITGIPYRRGVICTRPIGPRRGVEVANPPLHRENLETTVLYILKGVTPELAGELGVTKLEPGGKVIGKRCGTSQNIGPKARAKARRAPAA